MLGLRGDGSARAGKRPGLQAQGPIGKKADVRPTGRGLRNVQVEWARVRGEMIQACGGSPEYKTGHSSGDAEAWLRRRQGCHVTAAARAGGPREAQEPRAGFQNVHR